MRFRKALIVAVPALAAGLLGVFLFTRTGPSRPGPLRNIGGLRVLVLEGTPREQGFTHGYFLAEDIMSAGDYYIRNMPAVSSPAKRDALLRIVSLFFRRPKRYREEIEGLYEGIRAKLGEDGLHMPALGRKITVNDLWALNIFADWSRGRCSSYSAWGRLTADGEVVTGRNLDYYGREVIDRTAVVFVRRPSEPGRRSWVSLGFVGTIGCDSGMNSDGVVILTHDSDSTGKLILRYYPRSLVLRECIETVSPEGDVAENAAAILRRHPVFSGTNMHVSSPSSASGVA